MVEGLFVSSTEAWPVIAQILPFSLLAFVFLGLIPPVMRSSITWDAKLSVRGAFPAAQV